MDVDGNNFYVYIHRNLENGAIFYVGKGSKNRAKCKDVRNANWLEYITSNPNWTYEILFDSLSNKDALQVEIDVIKELLNFCEPLTNVAVLGNNAAYAEMSVTQRMIISDLKTGVKQSAEHIEKRVAKNIGQTRSKAFCEDISKRMSNRIVCDATRNKIRDFQTGRKHSEETCAKRRASQTGKKRSAEGCKNIQDASLKTGCKCNETGTSFISLQDGARWMISQGFENVAACTAGISRCVTGKQKSYKGYSWQVI
jgi:hypothetical protein